MVKRVDVEFRQQMVVDVLSSVICLRCPGLSPYVAVLALTILGILDIPGKQNAAGGGSGGSGGGDDDDDAMVMMMIAGPSLAGWLGARCSRSLLLAGR